MTMTAEKSAADLLRIARSGTLESRRVLLDNVADLFASEAGRLTERERALMADIMNRLVGEMEVVVRQSLAERLSPLPGMPRDLVVMLANDEIAVARPMLLHSRALRDPDLVEIVKYRGREHMLAVTLRAPLGAEVSDAIVDSGDEDAILSLLRNPDAQLSRAAYEYLVGEAERVDAFQDPLVRRHDLPRDLAARLYWMVSAALRSYIVAHHALDELMLDEFIEAAAGEAMADDEATRAHGAEAAAERLVATLARRQRLDLQFAVAALRRGRVPVFLSSLVFLAEIPMAQARRIFFDEGADSIAILVRALGADRATFSTIYLLSRQARGRGLLPPSALNDALGFFDGLSHERARATLGHWRRNPAYATALAEQVFETLDAPGSGQAG